MRVKITFKPKPQTTGDATCPKFNEKFIMWEAIRGYGKFK